MDVSYIGNIIISSRSRLREVVSASVVKNATKQRTEFGYVLFFPSFFSAAAALLKGPVFLVLSPVNYLLSSSRPRPLSVPPILKAAVSAPLEGREGGWQGVHPTEDYEYRPDGLQPNPVNGSAVLSAKD